MADPDLEIRGGGQGRSSRPLQKGGPVSKKIFFAFGPQFGLKIRRGGGGGDPPLDPPLKFVLDRFSSLL